MPVMTGTGFKQKRGHLGLTQVQLAKRLGVSPNAVARWERGERRISEPVARLLTLLCRMQRMNAPRRKP
jgi:DNA-binding transcriptional regulator YiaG